jgi:hypothetical protein
MRFTAAFDEIFRSEGLRVIKTPIAAPRAKAHAERWVGSARRECLDRILIVSRRQLETVLREYVAYYNTHRPHRSLDQQPPLVKTAPIPAAEHEWRVRRRDRLGGVLHEYELAAYRPGAIFRTGSPPVCGSACLKHLRAVAGRDSSDLPGRETIPQSRLSKTEPNKVEANRVSGTHTLEA